VDELEMGIAMERVNRLFVRRGAARRGALIGAASGAAAGALIAVGSQDDFGGGVFGAGFAFIAGTVVGAVIGGIGGHWVAVYP
jgi:hypothetical protein